MGSRPRVISWPCFVIHSRSAFALAFTDESSVIVQAELYDRLTQMTVRAEIAAMDTAQIRLANSSWTKSFQGRYRSRLHDADSWMWNTGECHLERFLQRAEMRSFALVAEDSILGVLFLQRQTQASRLSRDFPLAYVHYIATAPWNRRDTYCVGRLRGVGSNLIAWAVQWSKDAGCEGRLGLHSLRSSDGFYRHLRFRNLGHDAAHRGMNYFELAEASSTTEFLPQEACSSK